ncbi:M15 family metallopeptidase [Fusobacterium animalis]|uniref:M15 family metallopeptidase n=1 Tax=Fusobacterium animalis TaxID=76859 RepID=UPI0030D121A6
MYILSQTSLDKLNGVHPNLVNFMTELIKISPWNFKITAGVRTAEEQNKLYQQGRTVKGIKVTKVDGYKQKSNHQTKFDGLGYAADIGVLVTEKIIEKVKENEKEIEKEVEKIVYKGSWKDFHYYQDIYNVAKEKGLLEKYGIEWGGNCWKSFKDAPHWQIKGADKVAFK